MSNIYLEKIADYEAPDYLGYGVDPQADRLEYLRNTNRDDLYTAEQAAKVPRNTAIGAGGVMGAIGAGTAAFHPKLPGTSMKARAIKALLGAGVGATAGGILGYSGGKNLAENHSQDRYDTIKDRAIHAYAMEEVLRRHARQYTNEEAGLQ